MLRADDPGDDAQEPAVPAARPRGRARKMRIPGAVPSSARTERVRVTTLPSARPVRNHSALCTVMRIAATTAPSTRAAKTPRDEKATAEPAASAHGAMIERATPSARRPGGALGAPDESGPTVASDSTDRAIAPVQTGHTSTAASTVAPHRPHDASPTDVVMEVTARGRRRLGRDAGFR